MIYTLEVRFPLSIFNSTSNLSSLNQTQDPSASTDSPSLSTRSSNTSKVILLNRQSGDSLVERIVLAELERRSSEEMKNGGSLKGGSISTDSVENENGISETTGEKTERIKEAQGVESVGTGNGNGIENSTTTKPPGTKLSKREKKRLKKEANATNPDANQSNATSSSSNSKGKSKDSKKAQDSRLQDPDFEPSFKVSEKLWKGVGIEVQLQSNGDEIYQTLPSTSKLLLPIFESRLRNETSLKYLDWFERQKTKEGREGIGGQIYGDGNGLEGGWSNSSATGKGKGREMNSNNIPLGNRTSIPAPPSNSHPSNSHASTSIPHYDGPPPGFYTGPPPGFGNAQNSRPHLYSGPPPSTLSQLPDRPRPQFSSPQQTTSSALQSQSESDPTSSSSPIKTNPLVSSSLLNKLSGIIPGGNRSRENSRSQTNEELKSLGGGIEGTSWEDLEKLEKSSKAETLFESLEKSKSSSNFDGASTSNSISSSKNQSTNSKHPRRPRILLSLKSTDSLEHALKNLPEGFEVVEYACLELWSTEKVEEMKVRGEIVIMELGMGLGDQELVVKESRSTTAEGFSDLKNGNGRKRSESESQNPVQEEKDIKRQRINSEPSKMESTKFAIGIRSSPVKEVATSSLGTLVGGYGSDSDEEEEAEVSIEKIQSMVAKSELLTGEEEEDQVMKEVEEEEEEENWGIGLAGMARAFGIAPQAEKNEKSELAKEGAGQTMGGGGLEEGGEAKGEWDQTVILKIESQGDEELDWGEE